MLTSGRRWSRGRLGGEVYEGGVEVHAGGRPPRLLLLVPSWFTSFPLRHGAAPPGRVDGVPAVKWSLLQFGSRLLPCPVRCGGGAPTSFSNLAQTGRWWMRKPQEGVGGLASEPRRPAPFESKPRAARGGKALHAPGRSPGRPGGARGRGLGRLGFSVEGQRGL
jgi:hypothetical protein